jgi:hypothetical protein
MYRVLCRLMLSWAGVYRALRQKRAIASSVLLPRRVVSDLFLPLVANLIHGGG